MSGFTVGALDSNNVVDSISIPMNFLVVNSGIVVDPVSGRGESFKIYNNGTVIPDANPNNYLIFPANYTVAGAVAVANLVASLKQPDSLDVAYGYMLGAFHTNGSQDLQRGQQWNIPSGDVVPAFADAASYSLGLITGLAELPLSATKLGGGA